MVVGVHAWQVPTEEGLDVSAGGGAQLLEGLAPRANHDAALRGRLHHDRHLYQVLAPLILLEARDLHLRAEQTAMVSAVPSADMGARRQLVICRGSHRGAVGHFFMVVLEDLLLNDLRHKEALGHVGNIVLQGAGSSRSLAQTNPPQPLYPNVDA